MAYFPTENRLGLPVVFSQIDSDAYPVGSPVTTFNRLQPGTVVRGQDSSLGGGDFIYLGGVAGTVVGSVVTFDAAAGTTALLPITTKNLDKPVAVALSANTTAANFGWYQISGVAVVKKTAVKVNPGVPLYGSATTGRLMPTAASGRQILNCISVNLTTIASATSTVNALLNRSFIQGAVL